MPAVHRAGLRQVQVHVPDSGPGYYELRTVATPLAAALSPAPAPVGADDVLGLALLTFLLCLGGLVIVVSGIVAHSVKTWACGLSAFGAAIAVLVLAVRSRRRIARDHEERRACSERVWQQGWYCARCGTVHTAGPSRAMALEEFRQLVWGAGSFALPGVFHPQGRPPVRMNRP
ncbi:hypothetical protein DN069_22540 [Streptacidiphilus pinicola]|uniref:Uncharacterized protein n=1 Tax=Streptacidiphilus pinicola TaxID=2219663 RepID=A0A2X0IJ30_9ACTN|nr:hypothetical protein DN069_22540 [Streptacidiphilus pinicola]